MKQRKWVHYMIVLSIMLYLFLPLMATLLYSMTTDWYTSILPKNLSLTWYTQLFQDHRFIDALIRSLFVCTVTVILSVCIMVPTIFVVVVYFPAFEKWLQALVLLPFAIPGVVAAVGLIKLYSSGPIVLAGTVWILIFAFFIMILPFMYQGIRNSMRTIQAHQLVQTAELLGASKLKSFYYVVFPNILPGITVSSLLAFSILFGEFVLTNLLVGGHYETIQVYLMRRLNENGHLSSAIVISYFSMILVISAIVLVISNRMATKSFNLKEEK